MCVKPVLGMWTDTYSRPHFLNDDATMARGKKPTQEEIEAWEAALERAEKEREVNRDGTNGN